MSTIRSKILDAFESELASLSFGTRQSRMLPTELGRYSLPFCFIFVNREEKLQSGSDTVVGKETWNADIVVFLLSKEADVESNISSIYSKLFDNSLIDNIIVRKSLTRLDYFVVQTDREIVGVSMVWQVLYRHSLGNMEVE